MQRQTKSHQSLGVRWCKNWIKFFKKKKNYSKCRSFKNYPSYQEVEKLGLNLAEFKRMRGNVRPGKQDRNGVQWLDTEKAHCTARLSCSENLLIFLMRSCLTIPLEAFSKRAHQKGCLSWNLISSSQHSPCSGSMDLEHGRDRTLATCIFKDLYVIFGPPFSKLQLCYNLAVKIKMKKHKPQWRDPIQEPI